MYLKILKLVVITSFVLVGTKLTAKTVYYGTQRLQISVQYGQETLFKFSGPVKTISNASKFIIKPANKENKDYKLLSIQPRTKSGYNNVSFLLTDGSIIKTKLKIAFKPTLGSLSEIYEIKSKETVINNEQDRVFNKNFSELDLLKAMMRGDFVAGYSTRIVNKKIYTGRRGLRARLVKVYVGSKYNGYVIRLENKSRKETYNIDIRKLKIGDPNLSILSQIDKPTLKPKSKKRQNVTYMRVVASGTSEYQEMVLPITYQRGGTNK